MTEPINKTLKDDIKRYEGYRPYLATSEPDDE